MAPDLVRWTSTDRFIGHEPIPDELAYAFVRVPAPPGGPANTPATPAARDQNREEPTMTRKILSVALGATVSMAFACGALFAHGGGGGGFRGGGGGFRGGGGFGGGGFRGGYGGGGYGGFRGGYGGGYGGVRGGYGSVSRTPTFGSYGHYGGNYGGGISYGARTGSYTTNRGTSINYGAAGIGGRGPAGGVAGRGVAGASVTEGRRPQFHRCRPRRRRDRPARQCGGRPIESRRSFRTPWHSRRRPLGMGGLRRQALWIQRLRRLSRGWVHGYWNGHNSAAWGWRNPYWGGYGGWGWGMGWGLGLGYGLGWGLSSWGFGSSLYGMGYMPYNNIYYVDNSGHGRAL